MHDGVGSPSDPSTFRINRGNKGNPLNVNIPSIDIAELAVAGPPGSGGFSSGSPLVLDDPVDCPDTSNLNVFSRFEQNRVGNVNPFEVFSALPGSSLQIPSNPPNPYVSAPLFFNLVGEEDPARNLGLAFSSVDLIPSETRILIWMNNHNTGTVIGPSLIPTDGSYTSLSVGELQGWPPGTFSEPFQEMANLTLNIPNQQSVTEAPLEPSIHSRCRFRERVPTHRCPSYGGHARYPKRSESAPGCRGELDASAPHPRVSSSLPSHSLMED